MSKLIFLGIFLSSLSAFGAEKIQRFQCTNTSGAPFPKLKAVVKVDPIKVQTGIGNFKIQVREQKAILLSRVSLNRGGWTISRLTAYETGLFFIAENYFVTEPEETFEAQLILAEVPAELSKLSCSFR